MNSMSQSIRVLPAGEDKFGEHRGLGINLNLLVDFTGEILAGDQFIRDQYVYMGFQPAWKFEIVYQLTLAYGSVLDVKDISEDMQRVREGMVRASKQDLEK